MENAEKQVEIYSKAFKETYLIVNNFAEELYAKIPKSFMKMLKENMDNSYKVTIRDLKINREIEETRTILSLIYRDFLCDEQEKQELLLRDSENLQKLEEELKQRYDTEEIFKKRKDELNKFNNIEVEAMAMVEVKEKNFLQKIFQKIKHFFTRKNS